MSVCLPDGLQSALNVTLQDSKYRNIARSLNSKLLEYDRMLASLKPVERQLLKAHIEDLNAAIKVTVWLPV